MTSKASTIWFYLRFPAIGLLAWGIASSPVDKSNLNWTAAFVIAPIVSASILFWILALRLVIGRDFEVDADWPGLLSFSSPFFPMMRYPLRFWLIVGFGMILGGAGSILMNVSGSPGSSGFGGVFLLTGIGICISIAAAQKIFWYSTSRLQK